MPFDYQGAKQAGYSDEEILGHLQKENPKFDYTGALNTGYSVEEIAKHVQEYKEPIYEKVASKIVDVAGKGQAKLLEKGPTSGIPAIAAATALFNEIGAPALKTKVGHGAVRAISGLWDLPVSVISKGLSQIPGLEGAYKEGDIGNVFKSVISRDPKDQPMTTAERLQGVGVPPNTAKIAGMGIDVLGPSYIGKGFRTLGKITGVKAPVPTISEAVQKTGYNLYKRGFKNVDEAGRFRGVGNISDVLFEKRWSGDPSKLFKRNISPEKATDFLDFAKKFDVEIDPGDIQRYMTGYRTEAESILKNTNKVIQTKPAFKNIVEGKKLTHITPEGKINLNQAINNSPTVQKIVAKAKEYASVDPRLEYLPAEIEGVLANYSKYSNVGLDELADLKRTFQGLAKDYKTSFQSLKGGKITNIDNEFFKDIGGLSNKIIKETISEVAPELGKNYSRAMNKMATLQEIYGAELKNIEKVPTGISPFEVASAARGYPQLAIARQAIEQSKSIPFTTGTGLKIFRTGQAMPTITSGAKALPYAIDPTSGAPYSPANPYGQ